MGCKPPRLLPKQVRSGGSGESPQRGRVGSAVLLCGYRALFQLSRSQNLGLGVIGTTRGPAVWRPQLKWVLLGTEQTLGKGWSLPKIAQMDEERVCVCIREREVIVLPEFLSRITF